MAPESGRLLLIDNDAFVLLAGSGHLESVLGLLGLTFDDCRYNAPFPFVFRKKIKPGLPPTVADRIEAAMNQVRRLEHAPSATTLQQLQDVHEIDVGEAILFGVLAEHPATLLTTNDKRALRTLSSTPALAPIKQAVTGRILAVESIIQHLVEKQSVATVADGFVEVSTIDKRLSVIFSANNVAHPEQCSEAIESYLKLAVEECGEGFFYSFD
jgi:hypothetical protein